MHETDDQLRALDPVQSEAEPDETTMRQILSAQRTLTGESRHLSSMKSRWVVGAAATVTLSLALALTQLGGVAPQPALAVTPASLSYQTSDRPAADVLDRIAKRTENLPDDSRPGTTHLYIQDSWSLSTRIDGVQVTSAVIPEHRKTWVKLDGSQRWKARTQKPQFESDKQRKEWEDSGAVGDEPRDLSGSAGPRDRTIPPPAQAEEMRKWLTQGSPQLDSGQLFSRIREVYLDNSFSPRQRAWILGMIANAPGVSYRGEVVDRAGRTGAGFSVNSNYRGLDTQYSVIVDPQSGKLLSYEEELTGSAGALNVKTPAVIAYVTYLAS
ncbi:CU044_5270 family protein [Streptomyces sp. NPDC057565]|uniref:CU044_5270 family protein n=1 Tax=Streptomyces sp. NPDC057565 TaxID=3346169 RepID=UPI0036AAA1E5